jgi:hypothetical protein
VLPLEDLIEVVEACSPADVIRRVQNSSARHIIQKDGLFFEAELDLAKRMVSDPLGFIQSPIETIFNQTYAQMDADDEYRSLKLQLTPMDRKTVVLKAFETFMTALDGTRAILDQAYIVADELFTNGSKNAWPNGRGTDTPPTVDGTVQFFAHADKSRLVIGCRDSYGALGFDKILARIGQCYQNGVADSIQQGKCGAGIGSFMVFNMAISYYAGVDPNRCTVVCVSLPLGLSHRKIEMLGKNIHLVSVK